jgi:hypothetical protein
MGWFWNLVFGEPRKEGKGSPKTNGSLYKGREKNCQPILGDRGTLYCMYENGNMPAPCEYRSLAPRGSPHNYLCQPRKSERTEQIRRDKKRYGF